MGVPSRQTKFPSSHGCLPEVLGHCQGPVAYQMDMSAVVGSRCSTYGIDRVESTMYANPYSFVQQASKQPSAFYAASKQAHDPQLKYAHTDDEE